MLAPEVPDGLAVDPIGQELVAGSTLIRKWLISPPVPVEAEPVADKSAIVPCILPLESGR